MKRIIRRLIAVKTIFSIATTMSLRSALHGLVLPERAEARQGEARLAGLSTAAQPLRLTDLHPPRDGGHRRGLEDTYHPITKTQTHNGQFMLLNSIELSAAAAAAAKVVAGCRQRSLWRLQTTLYTQKNGFLDGVHFRRSKDKMYLLNIFKCSMFLE